MSQNDDLSAQMTEAIDAVAEHAWQATATDEERVKEAVKAYHVMQGIPDSWMILGVTAHSTPSGDLVYVVLQGAFVTASIPDGATSELVEYRYYTHHDLVVKGGDAFRVIPPLNGGGDE